MSLRERRDIAALSERAAPGSVLITLVRATGSTYRKPGARLLVQPDGTFAGTISGGCLEAELLRKATWKVRDGAIVEHFSTAFDDTAEIPYGLGCGGEVDVLLEPADGPEAQALFDALQASLEGEASLIVTVLPQDGKRFGRVVIHEGGNVTFASDHISTDDVVDLRAFARQRLTPHSAETTHSFRHVFLERIATPQRLVIFGAGEDAKPLASLASQIGWDVVISDKRPQHAKPERFPAATVVTQFAPQNTDAVVLMTHSFEEDRHLLTQMLALKPRYLGLLGAKHRSSLLLSEAAPAAHLTLAEACNRLHAPVGLDLGGDGPETVALSIVAEIQAALHNRPAAMRGMTEADVQQQIAEHGASRALCALDSAQ